MDCTRAIRQGVTLAVSVFVLVTFLILFGPSIVSCLLTATACSLKVFFRQLKRRYDPARWKKRKNSIVETGPVICTAVTDKSSITCTEKKISPIACRKCRPSGGARAPYDGYSDRTEDFDASTTLPPKSGASTCKHSVVSKHSVAASSEAGSASFGRPPGAEKVSGRDMRAGTLSSSKFQLRDEGQPGSLEPDLRQHEGYMDIDSGTESEQDSLSGDMLRASLLWRESLLNTKGQDFLRNKKLPDGINLGKNSSTTARTVGRNVDGSLEGEFLSQVPKSPNRERTRRFVSKPSTENFNSAHAGSCRVFEACTSSGSEQANRYFCWSPPRSRRKPSRPHSPLPQTAFLPSNKRFSPSKLNKQRGASKHRWMITQKQSNGLQLQRSHRLSNHDSLTAKLPFHGSGIDPDYLADSESTAPRVQTSSAATRNATSSQGPRRHTSITHLSRRETTSNSGSSSAHDKRVTGIPSSLKSIRISIPHEKFEPKKSGD